VAAAHEQHLEPDTVPSKGKEKLAAAGKVPPASDRSNAQIAARSLEAAAGITLKTLMVKADAPKAGALEKQRTRIAHEADQREAARQQREAALQLKAADDLKAYTEQRTRITQQREAARQQREAARQLKSADDLKADREQRTREADQREAYCQQRRAALQLKRADELKAMREQVAKDKAAEIAFKGRR
jgi:hypothetical protein